MHRLTLRHPLGSTALLIGEGALGAAHEELGSWLDGRTVFFVTAPQVRALHGDSVMRHLGAASRVVTLEVPDGEAAKSLEVAGRLWQEMLDAGGKRDSRVVALGGGTVGDLAGFAAGCFLRGVDFVQIPTTLLAQVDASIGGKTGIDMPGTKNSVGLFHHPAMVVSEARFLETLPRHELRAGLAEVVKAAILGDEELFETLERDLPRLLAGNARALGPVVVEAARIKVGVVERDDREAGERKLLNLGHTLAHALEACLGYEGLSHGDAVSYGLLFCLRLAEARGFDDEDAERIRAFLVRMQLPTLPAVDPADLLAAMSRDKKAREDGLAWVLPTRLGSARIETGIPWSEVQSQLGRFLEEPFEPA